MACSVAPSKFWVSHLHIGFTGAKVNLLLDTRDRQHDSERTAVGATGDGLYLGFSEACLLYVDDIGTRRDAF
jgi:hypothetical protein